MVAHGCKMPPKYEWVNLCDNECVIMSRQTDRQLTTTATMRLIIGGPIDILMKVIYFMSISDFIIAH